MVNNQKNISAEAKEYQAFQKEREFKRPIFKNCLKAFFIGGIICLIGQLITTFYIYFFDFPQKFLSFLIPNRLYLKY